MPRYFAPDDEAAPGGGTPSFDVGGAMDNLFDEAKKAAEEPDEPELPGMPAAAPSPPAPSPRQYPKAWKPDYTELWNSLPETHAAIKDEALRREDDFHRGIEGYKSNAALGERFNKLLEPYAAILTQYNVNPDQLVGNLLQAQMSLALGKPEDRISLMRRLLSDYKIDPRTLVEGAPEPDAALGALHERLGSIESALTQQQAEALSNRRAAIASEVEAFAKAHEHFAALQDEISVILQGNPKATLQDAYDQAVWMNPATREKVLAAKAKADADAAAEATRKHAEDAARASKGSIRTPSRSASPTAPAGTMDDTMKETLAAIHARG
jgi:hypothetical protein